MTDESFLKDAQIVFERTIYNDSQQDIEMLRNNMILLYKHGLEKVNRKLIENCRSSSRNIWDFMVEHNLAIEIIKTIDQMTTIEYEPDYLDGTVDFVLSRGKTEYYLQVKNLSDSERQNRRKKTVETIKKELMEIKVGKFISIQFSEDFNEADVQPFIENIKQRNYFQDKVKNYYSKEKIVKASFSFHSPNISIFEHLKIGTTSDMAMVNVTGEDRKQIYNSLLKAAKSFTWKASAAKLNFIVMEADNHYDIDISESVFGIERFQHYSNGKRSWNRDESGFFYNEYKNEVIGVIALRRREESPVSSYSKTLFINELFLEQVSQIKSIFNIDRCFRYNQLPEH
ncbi:hypothetical protein OB236_18385 [Paenibacillus sp. WQ 127069]|uniref:DUF4263 domain-containing protein n=1 Tax=Paenibacillus baimaensis TaxID=2982185 RepID=A0ABT2UHF5_9BACL|nr:hypothetical protein [Paenibacillus sp. WQ 127069]MCU6794074.1 hypothetical protein [Paenibacillus sp. WQ 127069]